MSDRSTVTRLTLELVSPPGEKPWASLSLGLGLALAAIMAAMSDYGERYGEVISPAGRMMGTWTLTEEDYGGSS